MSEYIEFFFSNGLAFGFLGGFTSYFLARAVSFGLNLFCDNVE